MTPDQIHQVATEIIAGLTLLFGNRHLRKRETRKHLASEDSMVCALKAESGLLRDEMENTRSAIARLEVKMEAREAAEEKTDRELENVRIEMHSLSGRVDAANSLYTEMLQAAKARVAAAGQKLDQEPPVTGTVTFKEEKKKNG